MIVFCALAFASVAAVLLALRAGSLGASWADVLAALGGDASTTATAVIRELRLPRAVAAFASGALLALSGALMQVLLRNPLADPYVLGISGGAAAGALAAMWLGLGLGVGVQQGLQIVGPEVPGLALGDGQAGRQPRRLDA